MNAVVYAGAAKPVQEAQWHIHEEWELMYCPRGGRLALESGDELECGPGDLAAVPPRVPHMAQGGGCRIMRLDAPALRDMGAFRVSGDLDGRFAFVFSQAEKFFDSDIPRREQVLEALGDLVTGYILTELNAACSEPVERILAYINRGFTRTDFTLDDIIKEMSFNYDYLRRSFKKEMGMTPHEYVTELRMRRASELLGSEWSPTRTVTEVAELCGYSDPLYFSRVFRKRYGCSPSAFSKKARRDGKLI